MTMDQDENVPALGEQQQAPPVLSCIETFRPLVPTGDMKSTSQRLQNIFETNGSPSSFGYVVSKQWRADSVADRSTWAVVGTAMEAKLLEQGLFHGLAADVTGGPVDSQFVAAPESNEALAGAGIVIMTFDPLVETLSQHFRPGEGWEWDAAFGSPTVVMNFAWGNMSFEMALACLFLASLIKYMILNSP
ncbi:hypothetical protein UCDDA912_g06386 [Diaporthe ampelina]|uniref:Uncharacterized protein n=1 Tax=Diaporthe ampelina TaxID=1214573 RepID=A0A0G2FHR6_9PEZI|nr:hypothetical protein UCDDA912_g06386 [Diaporthe ampelina]